MVKYYYPGSTRIAMRQGSTLNWLFGDHFCRKPRQTFGGSTSAVANADGTPLANGEQRYKLWGEKRYPTGASGLPITSVWRWVGGCNAELVICIDFDFDCIISDRSGILHAKKSLDPSNLSCLW
jgi:hypothetical protein